VERKLVTIVFADLVGSTALADEQDPERTRALLDRFYDEMAAEIAAAGGTVEKFAGDAVMAAFGAPAAHEDDAERALHAALAMQRRLREFDDRLSLRIGVNTGEVVVDRPREGSSFVTGDAVNVAARLEQAAEPDEILVGERTVMATRGAFEFGDPTSIEAKGKGRLDVLGTLGDREHVQAEAPVLGVPGTYLEPFALRALALVEEDEALLERAIERFEAMNLAWHADETRKLKAET
jgi:class 3 adenylate cyclase